MTIMEDLSLHILDIAENATRAGGKRIVIEIAENEDEDRLTIRIEDDGKGMDRQTLEEATNPFFTTKGGKRFGLGLSLLAQAARQTGGELTIESREGVGTRVIAVFRPSHPDMKPMGNIAETMAILIAGNPGVRFVFDHRTPESHYHFDSFESG